MVKKISILGATGSIGMSTLDVVRAMPGAYEVTALAAGNNWEKLAELAREFSPKFVAIANAEHLSLLQEALSEEKCEVLGGMEGITRAVVDSGSEMLVSAAVGAAGLMPTLAAIDCGMDIALANKETLVMAGTVVMERVRQKGVRLLPVDSEHSAIFQALLCGEHSEVRRIVLTASGGAFRGKTAKDLTGMTAKEALAHPTWDMGPKITIDSATLVNKALEVIEAHWLFGMDYDNIEVVVHPQSVVHSMVDFDDGATIAQLGPTDMRIPIQYALTYPERAPSPVPPMDLASIGALTFERPDRSTFPCLDLGYRAGRMGGVAPAVYSAANEAAVGLFLKGKIAFPHIASAINTALEEHRQTTSPSLEDILEADRWAREFVNQQEFEPVV